MTDQTKAPEAINLVILQADKDGQLGCFTHPIMKQFSSEYMRIVANALGEVSEGMKADADGRAVEEAEAAKRAAGEPEA